MDQNHINDDIEGLPHVDFNIDLNELIFEKKIGTGAFGEVWKASYLGTEVAVKKMFDSTDSWTSKLIKREIKALR